MVLAVGPPSCGVLTQKDYNIVTQEGGKTLAEFPNSIEIGKLGPGQDPNNKEHSTTSLVE
jgi:hypothetical protein